MKYSVKIRHTISYGVSEKIVRCRFFFPKVKKNWRNSAAFGQKLENLLYKNLSELASLYQATWQSPPSNGFCQISS